MWRGRLAAFLSGGTAAALGPSFPAASESAPHRSGFTVYARVVRPDDTYRVMLVDDASLTRIREGRSMDGATILMESYAGRRMTSVFVKRREQGRWSYGAVRPGEGLEAFRPGPHCASCHRSVQDRDGMFTADMLKGFAVSGEIQAAFCDLPGRSPCGADVYRASGHIPDR
jgi:hypothetical protein